MKFKKTLTLVVIDYCTGLVVKTKYFARKVDKKAYGGLRTLIQKNRARNINTHPI